MMREFGFLTILLLTSTQLYSVTLLRNELHGNSECGGSVLRLNSDTEEIELRSHKTFGISVYPSNYVCRWLLYPESCSLHMKCKVNSYNPKRNSLVCDKNSDSLRIIAHKSRIDATYCGNQEIHLKFGKKDALVLMFNAGPRNKTLSIKESFHFAGFSCIVRCHNESFTSSIISSTTENTASSSTGEIETSTLENKSSNTCSCGRLPENTMSRIVCPRGENCDAKRGNHPWQVGLVWSSGDTKPWCGGSIISNRYILSAAHCLVGKVPSKISVLLGAYDWSKPDNFTILAPVEKIILHHGFESRSTYDNDFALLKLKNIISFNTFVVPICLPYHSEEHLASIGVVSGWGVVNPLDVKYIQATKLQEVSVKVKTQKSCQKTYGTQEITNSMFCASSPGADSCFGDSGGPLAMKFEGRTYIEGLVSWGRTCGSSKFPGVYAKVRNSLDWIVENIQDSGICTETEPLVNLGFYL